MEKHSGHNSGRGQSFDQGATEEDDCDSDGMGNDAGDDESQDNEMARRRSLNPKGMDSDESSSTTQLDMPSSGEISYIVSNSPSSDHSNHEHASQHSVESVPDNSNHHDVDVSLLRFFGRLALSSMTGNNLPLDYALVEIAPEMVESIKQVSFHGITANSLVFSAIGSDDIDIVSATSQHFLVEGQITATPSYTRLPGHDSLQQVYPILLDKRLSNGDCGAAVVGKDNCHLYGHIVAGGSGTGIAYIVPASEVFEDLKTRLGPVMEPRPQREGQAANSATISRVKKAVRGVRAGE
ncbi:hypothetical protein NQ176_g1057 [Zarea fungicola]|uniref:Uncharacterized protein n=1 Tax=Zarea fungicola TaxID=93591 RepID=A0ACC1NX84_9HYPO|nr:hypothetical protein NQ176_g1057 [Lecanicillium fungicola]